MQLGIEDTFDVGGFTGIVKNEPLKVGEIGHHAKLEVTKDGSLGVATSSVGSPIFIRRRKEVVSKPIVINKPFIFFVRETLLHPIIFAGKVTNPQNNE